VYKQYNLESLRANADMEVLSELAAAQLSVPTSASSINGIVKDEARKMDGIIASSLGSNKGSKVGRWTLQEHKKFLEGYAIYGRNWKKISEMIGTRSNVQCRTHAQKHFKRLGMKPSKKLRYTNSGKLIEDESTDEDTEREEFEAVEQSTLNENIPKREPSYPGIAASYPHLSVLGYPRFPPPKPWFALNPQSACFSGFPPVGEYSSLYPKSTMNPFLVPLQSGSQFLAAMAAAVDKKKGANSEGMHA
jgi:SHAQKYF class myb-like DNA-binding protein